ncbi:hypothetical protein MLD38_000631 [Melastoma candidum]|uniref:Uncharacterized protein n=1 Tax=Melastoma candidum TaxID=119954 RepID=A0ACB9SAH5_9MYRT|nr:hypothetical protein MLD38_000631 [Melastoma candidum]
MSAIFLPAGLLLWVFSALFVGLCFGVRTGAQPCDPRDLSALREFAGNLTGGSVVTAWSDDERAAGGMVYSVAVSQMLSVHPELPSWFCLAGDYRESRRALWVF